MVCVQVKIDKRPFAVTEIFLYVFSTEQQLELTSTHRGTQQ